MSAQTATKQDGKPTREQLAKAQARHIAQNLALDDKTADKFVETFCTYQSEIWALGSNQARMRAKADSLMTDAEVAKAIEERFEHSRKILDIREKYYKEYSKFLTPKQIQKVYESERRMMDRLSQSRQRPGQPARQGQGQQTRPPRYRQSR